MGFLMVNDLTDYYGLGSLFWFSPVLLRLTYPFLLYDFITVAYNWAWAALLLSSWGPASFVLLLFFYFLPVHRRFLLNLFFGRVNN